MSRLLSWFFWFLIRIPLCLVFYGTPLVALWLASSLAAYMAGPPYLPWMVGVFMFPIIPGLWELYAWMHRNRERKPWFTPLDRISMRTFAVGLVFLAVMLYLYPRTSFVALSTRGDWMLDDVKDARAEQVRPVLFAAANGLEWLYKATKNNPYKALVDAKARQRAELATKKLDEDIAKKREKELALAVETDTKGNKTQDGSEIKKEDGKGVDSPDGKKSDQQDGKTADKSDGKKSDQQDGKIAESDEKKSDQQDGKSADKSDGKKSDQQDGKEAADKSDGKKSDPDGKEAGKSDGKKSDQQDGKEANKPDGKKLDRQDGKVADKTDGKKSDSQNEKNS